MRRTHGVTPPDPWQDRRRALMPWVPLMSAWSLTLNDQLPMRPPPDAPPPLGIPPRLPFCSRYNADHAHVPLGGLRRRTALESESRGVPSAAGWGVGVCEGEGGGRGDGEGSRGEKRGDDWGLEEEAGSGRQQQGVKQGSRLVMTFCRNSGLGYSIAMHLYANSSDSASSFVSTPKRSCPSSTPSSAFPSRLGTGEPTIEASNSITLRISPTTLHPIRSSGDPAHRASMASLNGLSRPSPSPNISPLRPLRLCSASEIATGAARYTSMPSSRASASRAEEGGGPIRPIRWRMIHADGMWSTAPACQRSVGRSSIDGCVGSRRRKAQRRTGIEPIMSF